MIIIRRITRSLFLAAVSFLYSCNGGEDVKIRLMSSPLAIELTADSYAGMEDVRMVDIGPDGKLNYCKFKMDGKEYDIGLESPELPRFQRLFERMRNELE